MVGSGAIDLLLLEAENEAIISPKALPPSWEAGASALLGEWAGSEWAVTLGTGAAVDPAAAARPAAWRRASAAALRRTSRAVNSARASPKQLDRTC